MDPRFVLSKITLRAWLPSASSVNMGIGMKWMVLADRYKTPQEYARAYTEFAKVMKWVDPEY